MVYDLIEIMTETRLYCTLIKVLQNQKHITIKSKKYNIYTGSDKKVDHDVLTVYIFQMS